MSKILRKTIQTNVEVLRAFFKGLAKRWMTVLSRRPRYSKVFRLLLDGKLYFCVAINNKPVFSLSFACHFYVTPQKITSYIMKSSLAK